MHVIHSAFAIFCEATCTYCTMCYLNYFALIKRKRTFTSSIEWNELTIAVESIKQHFCILFKASCIESKMITKLCLWWTLILRFQCDMVIVAQPLCSFHHSAPKAKYTDWKYTKDKQANYYRLDNAIFKADLIVKLYRSHGESFSTFPSNNRLCLKVHNMRIHWLLLDAKKNV